MFNLSAMFSNIKEAQIKIVNRLHYLNKHKVDKDELSGAIENVINNISIDTEKIERIPESITLSGDVIGEVSLTENHDPELLINTKLNSNLDFLNASVSWDSISGKPDYIINFNPDDYVKNNDEYQILKDNAVLNNTVKNIKIQWSQITNPPTILSSNADLVSLPYFVQMMSLISSKFDAYISNLANKVDNLDHHLPEARRITLNGVVNGEAFFDGSKDIVIETSLNDLSLYNISTTAPENTSTNISTDNTLNIDLSNLSVKWGNVLEKPNFNFDETYITSSFYEQDKTQLLNNDIPLKIVNELSNSAVVSGLITQQIYKINKENENSFLTLETASGHFLNLTTAAQYFLGKNETIKYNNILNAPTDLGHFNNELSGYLRLADLDDIYVRRADMPTMETVPKKVSQLENDSGYLTAHQPLDIYATKDWVISRGFISHEQSLTEYATMDWVRNQKYLTTHQSLSNYVTKSDLNSYAKKSDLPIVPDYISAFRNNAGYITKQDLDSYAKKSELPDTVVIPKNISVFNNDSNYLLPSSLNGYATETWVKNQKYLTSHQSLDNYATTEWILNKKYLTSHQSLAGYATESWVNNKKYLTQASLNEFALKKDLTWNSITNKPTIPTTFCCPDFSKQIFLYDNTTDYSLDKNGAIQYNKDGTPKSSGYGFRIRGLTSETTKGNAMVFLLKYPCFIYTEIKTFAGKDTDMLLEMSPKFNTCVLANAGTEARYYAAKAYAEKQNSTWCWVVNCGSQSMSFLTPLGTVDWWHHYATGACGSSDSGDATQRNYWIVPIYGTPKGTLLAKLYRVVYKGYYCTDDPKNKTWINLIDVNVGDGGKYFVKDIICP